MMNTRTALAGAVVAATAGLVACSPEGASRPGPEAASISVHEVTPSAPDIEPSASELPPAVAHAAHGIVSVAINSLTLYRNNPNLEERTPVDSGSGTYIGNGKVLTARHLAATFQGQSWTPYACRGDQVSARDANGNLLIPDVDNVGLPRDLADIALLGTGLNLSPDMPSVKVAETIDSTEQVVYFANYQSLQKGESASGTFRDPSATSPELQRPAIFSGIAQFEKKKNRWVIISAPNSTQSYGSGNPTHLTPGGSGGALLNAAGELIGETTSIVSASFVSATAVEMITGIHFNSLPDSGPYEIQYAQLVTSTVVDKLENNQAPCPLGADDKIVG